MRNKILAESVALPARGGEAWVREILTRKGREIRRPVTYSAKTPQITIHTNTLETSTRTSSMATLNLGVGGWELQVPARAL